MTSRFVLPAPFADHSVATGLFIGGCWLAGKAHAEVANPGNGKKLTDVADGDEGDATAAVDAAAAAAPAWAATAPRRRADILRDCYVRMVAAADWLAFL